MCMALKGEYHKIDDSHIVMCAAQVIGGSAMTRDGKRAALSRVCRARPCFAQRVTLLYVVWRREMARRDEEAERRSAQVQRQATARARESNQGQTSDVTSVPLTCARQANPEMTVEVMRMHNYVSALAQITMAVNSGV